jgi:hypothetical protein
LTTAFALIAVGFIYAIIEIGPESLLVLPALFFAAAAVTFGCVAGATKCR